MSAIDDANTALATAQGALQRREALVALAVAALDQLSMHPEDGVLRPETRAQRAASFSKALTRVVFAWEAETGCLVEAKL
jgi:plasmid stabilization system protein ParE